MPREIFGVKRDEVGGVNLRRLHYKELQDLYPSPNILAIKLEFSRQIFFLKNSSNIKFHENPSNGSRVVSCGQPDVTKVIVAFRNFANAPKKCGKSLFFGKYKDDRIVIH